MFNCLVIFYDVEGDPIDTEIVKLLDIIYAGTSKRIKRSVSDLSVKELSTRTGRSDRYGHKEVLETYVKFRILDYEIAR